MHIKDSFHLQNEGQKKSRFKMKNNILDREEKEFVD